MQICEITSVKKKLFNSVEGEQMTLSGSVTSVYTLTDWDSSSDSSEKTPTAVSWSCWLIVWQWRIQEGAVCCLFFLFVCFCHDMFY